jgi:hypothetical protein
MLHHKVLPEKLREALNFKAGICQQRASSDNKVLENFVVGKCTLFLTENLRIC